MQKNNTSIISTSIPVNLGSSISPTTAPRKHIVIIPRNRITTSHTKKPDDILFCFAALRFIKPLCNPITAEKNITVSRQRKALLGEMKPITQNTPSNSRQNRVGSKTHIPQEIKKYCFLSDSENGQKNSAPTSSPYIIVRKIASIIGTIPA